MRVIVGSLALRRAGYEYYSDSASEVVPKEVKQTIYTRV